MKKILLLILILFYIQNTSAQEPTKQETMDWIASKFKTNLSNGTFMHFGERNLTFFYFKFIDYNYKGIITFNNESNDRTTIESNKEIIDFNKITNIEIYSNFLKITGLDGNDLLLESEGSGDNKTSYRIIDWKANGEVDLRNRMIKAFQLLIKYNNENKPKEKF